jgi:tetratricopeptide (TPR) repeat protein
VRADNKEGGAIYLDNAALQQAAYGNAAEARQAAAEALKLAPASQGVESEAALAFAMTGDTARADSLAQDLGKRFPLDTQMQSLWLPAIQAQLALDRRNPASALNALQAASPIELGQIGFVPNVSCLYHVYVRGEAYLAVGPGSAAAAEFQKILDHSGIVWNWWTGVSAFGNGSCERFGGENLAGSGCRCRPRAGACRLQRLPHPLEKRRPRHPDPQASQSRVCEAAIVLATGIV